MGLSLNIVGPQVNLKNSHHTRIGSNFFPEIRVILIP
jgi:hypothetical protein